MTEETTMTPEERAKAEKQARRMNMLQHGAGMTEAATQMIIGAFGEPAVPSIALGMVGNIFANVNTGMLNQKERTKFNTASALIKEMFIDCVEEHYTKAVAEQEKLVVLAPEGFSPQ